MNVLLLQLDGKGPNLALMRLAAYHRGLGDSVELRRAMRISAVERQLGDDFGRVYASAIFTRSRPIADRLRVVYPEALIGGTGVDETIGLESVGIATDGPLDYSDYPTHRESVGFSQRGCRLKCPFCLHPETMVITQAGLKAIRDMEVGDLVLTHEGRYRRVTEVMSRPFDGELISPDTGAVSRIFPCRSTAEHPFYLRHVSRRYFGEIKMTAFRWHQAGSLEVRPGRAVDKHAYPRTVEARLPEADRLPDGIPLTPDLMRIVGWYLAEGYLSRSEKRGIYRVTFCLGHSQQEQVYAWEINGAALAIGVKTNSCHASIGIRVSIDRVLIARWLDREFGHGAATKRIPAWVRQLPPEYLVPLLDAWSKGDGCFHFKRGTPTWRIATVSADLAVSLREIVLKLGYASSINKRIAPGVIQGRQVNVKPVYTVIYRPERATAVQTRTDDRYVYQATKDIAKEHYSGLVYNLEVEDDRSFCTPVFAVHNCLVPRSEGRPRQARTIAEIWRGEPYPKWILLLDNDFFAIRGWWEERISEIKAGGFRVCFNQGINARMLTDEAATAIASVDYRDDSFQRKRIYTAWDSLPDEDKLFRGLRSLVDHGVKPDHIMVYMLVGYWPGETAEDREYRRRRLREFGCRPYPMPFVRTPELVGFQRWVVGAYDRRIGWNDWRRAGYDPRKLRHGADMPLFNNSEPDG
jgi:hypothetical protein